ncbi:hypothetical protein MKZ38_006518 [Zalerion maritima]|uniref:Protein FYV10 n=1 Tax=Zalerion maritima TaxID=339359 RepID=A0AAD5WVI9_9PEZI|nr:hypothetical protein MKZ38_006518 [Zalerion maritima]
MMRQCPGKQFRCTSHVEMPEDIFAGAKLLQDDQPRPATASDVVALSAALSGNTHCNCCTQSASPLYERNMADHESAKLDHDNHLLLDQSLVRLPHELLRKNFRSAHVVVERDKEAIKRQLREATIKGLNGNTSRDDVLKSLDNIIARGKKLRTKLGACQTEESRLFQQTEARVKHLGQLQGLHTLDDVKYEGWSHARLDRLLVDYLLRQGYSDTACSLATERNIADLVDIETFVAMSRIQNSLRKGKSVAEALAWCADNKKELRKLNSNLEFSLRFQQYVELVRQQTPESQLLAIAHAKKYLYPYQQAYPKEVKQSCGLLVFTPNNPGNPQYAKLFSDDRWEMLADLFTRTYNELLSLPSIPLLHVALSSGLSALKTPACHSHTSGQGVNADGDVDMAGSTGSIGDSSGGAATFATESYTNGRMCPICSAELNELARNVPYAHHSKSHVDHDLMLLPNNRVYGLERLKNHAKKQGIEEGKVKDLRGRDVYDEKDLKKVYIT